MSRDTRGRAYWILLSFIIAALVFGGLRVAGVIRTPSHPVFGADKIPLRIAKSAEPVSLAEFKNGFSSVIDPILPMVVNISSTKVVKRPNQMPGFFFNDPFFRQFFGDQGGEPPQTPETQREQSLGSGVIVNGDGYILTNNHVIAGASDIEVFTPDRKKYKAKVIGTDPQTDVGVLKIEATGLPAITLADSSTLKVGDVVFAIGDPFGVGETATAGIVSATGRALRGAIERYEDFIQTDAAINPGNSGGALIDIHGYLVGINTAILAGNGGGNQGIGFAIPVNMARNVMEQIVQHGRVIRGQLGVRVQPVDPDMAKVLGLDRGRGALVGDVIPNSPAAKAGIQRGDVILELNGQEVNGPEDLSVRVAQTPPGSNVHLKVYRNGQTRDVTVTLTELAEQKTPSGGGEEGGGAALSGLKVENLTPDIARELQLPANTTGVVVTSIDPSSPAAAAGIQRGDVIQEVNRKPVHNVDEYRQAMEGTSGKPVLLLVNRGGSTRYVLVQPQ
jgi:serine protease Do